MLAKIREAIPDWRSQLASGNLKSIQRWLGANVHSQGDLYDPAELIMRIAGKKLDAEPYLSYLEEKYTDLYGF